MESNSNFCQEHFQVLAAEILGCGISDSFEEIAACYAGFCIYPRKGQIIIPWLEIVPFLFR